MDIIPFEYLAIKLMNLDHAVLSLVVVFNKLVMKIEDFCMYLLNRFSRLVFNNWF